MKKWSLIFLVILSACDAVVLYEIKEPPVPYFREYLLSRTGRFRYPLLSLG